jgi:hypothetical protein
MNNESALSRLCFDGERLQAEAGVSQATLSVELLVKRQQWLMSSEIAQALAIDLKVIQTELTPLSRQHVIRRRALQRNVPEKYEYAAQLTARICTGDARRRFGTTPATPPSYGMRRELRSAASAIEGVPLS